MTDHYEVRIVGTIGPLIAAGLPEFRVVAASSSTVLAGVADGPDALRRVLDLLDAHGSPPLDVRVNRRPGQSAGRAG